MTEDKKREHPPAFQFYANDFSSSPTVEAMSTLAVGAYMLLLCKAWYQDPVGTLPTNEETLSKWARVTKSEWKKIRESILAAFILNDGRYIQPRMQLEWQKMLEFKKSKSEAGLAGNQKRWQEHRKRVAKRSPCDDFAKGLPFAEDSQDDRTEIAESVANDRSSSSSSSSIDISPLPPLGENSEGGENSFMTGYSPEFEKWWETYPIRIGKGEAWIAWQAEVTYIVGSRGLTDAEAVHFLQVIAEDFARSPAGKESAGSNDYRPSPAKWLSSRRYEDDRSRWMRRNGEESTSPKKPRASSIDHLLKKAGVP